MPQTSGGAESGRGESWPEINVAAVEGLVSHDLAALGDQHGLSTPLLAGVRAAGLSDPLRQVVDDEPRVLQHLQVLGHRRPAHVHARGELAGLLEAQQTVLAFEDTGAYRLLLPAIMQTRLPSPRRIRLILLRKPRLLRLNLLRAPGQLLLIRHPKPLQRPKGIHCSAYHSIHIILQQGK